MSTRFSTRRKFLSAFRLFRRLKASILKPPSLGLLACWLLLIAASNALFFVASDEAQDCKFDKIERNFIRLNNQIEKVQFQQRILKLTIKNSDGKYVNPIEIDNVSKDYEKIQKSSDLEIRNIEKKIDISCEKIDTGAFNMFIIVLLFTAIFGFISLIFSTPKK